MLSPPTPSGSMLPSAVLPGDLFSWALEAEMVSLRRVQVCSESWQSLMPQTVNYTGDSQEVQGKKGSVLLPAG